MDTLFTHVSVVTMDENLTVLTDAFVGVTDGKIAYLGKTEPSEQATHTVDATGMVMMPGMINCHTQLPMTILRGYAEDCDLQTWLENSIFPREEKLDGRAAKAAALLGIAEAVRFGTTSVSDLYAFSDETCEAIAQSGIKANVARPVSYFEGEEAFDFASFSMTKEAAALHKKWHGYDNGRIQIEMGIHAEYAATPETWEAVSRYAAENGLGLQVRLSETEQENESCLERTGLTPAQVLDCHHVFDGRTAAVHCVHLTEEDRALLGRRHVSAVHCPTSNLKLASGRADVVALVKNGVNVALGTDSAAASNNLDLFAEMKLAALQAKELHGDAGSFSAQAALMMATVCGARAQGREKECGMLKVGMDADLILLDFTQPHLIPCHDLANHLVYAASGHDVAMTMVRGKVLYAQGKFPTIDLAGVISELQTYAIGKVFGDGKDEA